MSSLILTAMLVAQSAPAANFHELGQALYRCFHPPEHSAGSQMTVRFSLTRDGAVFGKPAVTFSKLVGAPADQEAFVQAALGAVAACTPVTLTPGFGAALAGRPITLRFVGGGAGTAI